MRRPGRAVLGSTVGLVASNRCRRITVAPGKRFPAAVLFNPGYFATKPTSGEPFEIVQPVLDRPLPAMVSELNNQTPAKECGAMLGAVKAAGAPVLWHIYLNTTHCCDCRGLDRFSNVDVRGNRVTHRYDEEVARDSVRRMFGFLDKNMEIRPDRCIAAN